MKLWKKTDVVMERQYVLLLLESSAGLRYFQLAEIELLDAIARDDSDFVFATRLVSTDLALGRNLADIASNVMLANGEPFYVDGHGNWFTKDEMDDLMKDRVDVRWVRGRMPKLPSR